MEVFRLANCEACKNRQNVENVPYVVHEAAMARAERAARRMWAVIILLILMLVGTNGAWLWYESQFEDVVTSTTKIEADAEDGGNAIANADGSVIFNG